MVDVLEDDLTVAYMYGYEKGKDFSLAENKRLLKRIEVLTSDRTRLHNTIKANDKLTHKLDVIINGKDASKETSLNDIVIQMRWIAKDAGM